MTGPLRFAPSVVTLVAVLTACPSDKPKPPPASVAEVAHNVPEPPRVRYEAVGALKFKVPDGFARVQNENNVLELRHVTDLTVRIGVVPRADPAKDVATVDEFLKGAEAELGKIKDAKVARETRTLPNSARVLRGVVAHTMDLAGPTPAPERREIWVTTDGPQIVTASFILLEGAPVSARALEQILDMIREALEPTP